jgi:hypothetical protein
MKRLVKGFAGVLTPEKNPEVKQQAHVGMVRKNMAVLALLMLLGMLANRVQAGTDATEIITAATTAFASVATLCVAIGTFFIVYRLVRRVA